MRACISPLIVGRASYVRPAWGKRAFTSLPAAYHSAYTWGNGESGQLGYSAGKQKVEATPRRLTPSDDPVDPVVQVACGGAHSLFRTKTGRVYSTGLNDDGQLGTGTNESSEVPQLIQGISRASHIAAGNFHSMIVTEDGVFSFGRNRYGQLGIGDRTSMNRPTLMLSSSDNSRFITATCGGDHTLILEGDTQDGGVVWGCGLALSGQLGFGSSKEDLDDHLEPRPVEALQDLRGSVTQVDAGVHHSAALLDSGEVYVWGDGHNGQIGGGQFFDHASPVKLEELRMESVRYIACGGFHTMMLNNFGEVWSTGLNSNGQIGTGFNQATVATPQKVHLGGEDVVRIVAGWQHSMALTREGQIFAWGHGLCGQLGLGHFNDVWDPEEVYAICVPDSMKLRGISAGWEHSAAW